MEQEEGWQLKGFTIIIHTSPFFTQQEQGLIISPLRAIEDVSSTQYLNTEDLIRGIKNNKSY